jgi:predicted permease
MFDNTVKDIRYAVRTLLKHPGFAMVAILTLALGIGANTALFSVVNGVLLRALPFPQPEQLVSFHQRKPNFDKGAIPYPNFLDLQKENKTFESMSISRAFGFSLVGTGEAERVNARYVTADFFKVFGLTPVVGRTFTPREDQRGATPVVLISEELWARKFASAANVIERSITLDDKSYAVVGVIPSSFTLFRNGDVFVPIGQWGNRGLENRGAALGLHGVGRLKPGVTLEQAQADLNRIMANLAVAYPETNHGNGSTVFALKDQVIGDVRPTLLMLFGAVGFVLLIACVNVSNLMLVRATGRTREFAVRAALGASRWRLLRQSLTESTLLAVIGGVFGLLFAYWGTHAAIKLLPSALPRAKEISLDRRVLLFTLAVSLLTGIVAGLAPALRGIRVSLSETLKAGGRGASSTHHRAQATFVAVEMALALVLLIGAGLMVRTLAELWKVDPGFRADNVLTFGLNLTPAMRSAEPEVVRNTWRELSDNIRSVPNVTAASFTFGAAPLQSEDDLFFWIEGEAKPASQSEMKMALVYQAEPDYLTAMGIPLKQGRFFTMQDDERSLPVVVIDEVLAQKYFRNDNPIGKRLFLPGQDNPYLIVGIVGHVKQWSLNSNDDQELQSQLYFPFRSLSDDSLPGGANMVIRYQGAKDEVSPALFASIRQVVERQNNQNIISSPLTMNQVISTSLRSQRFSMTLLASFALVALLLAAIGIYGVVSYLVRQRTHELGLRVALGAQRRDVLELVLGQGMKMTLAGVAIGVVAALILTRLFVKIFYGVTPTDPLTFVCLTLLLIGVALLACLAPAWRATKVDPMSALRDE